MHRSYVSTHLLVPRSTYIACHARPVPDCVDVDLSINMRYSYYVAKKSKMFNTFLLHFVCVSSWRTFFSHLFRHVLGGLYVLYLVCSSQKHACVSVCIVMYLHTIDAIHLWLQHEMIFAKILSRKYIFFVFHRFLPPS